MKKSTPSKTPRLIGLSIAVAVFVALIIIMVCLKTDVTIAEWWSRTVSRGIRLVLTSATNLIPFSVTEILIYLVIAAAISLIILIIVLLCRKKPRRALKVVLIITLTAVIIGSAYFATAGMEYNRKPLEGVWTNHTAEPNEFLLIANAYQTELNVLSDTLPRNGDGTLAEQYTFSETAKLVAEAVSTAADSDYFNTAVALPKKVLSSSLMSYLGISGLYLSVSGEASVNSVTYYSDLPFVMAHECAHSLGVMRENEANIFAFYALLGSQNDYLRYSALMYGYSQLRNGVYEIYGVDSEEFAAFSVGLAYNASFDKIRASEVWTEYSGWLNDLSSFFNGLYLKLSGVATGTDSYTIEGADVQVDSPADADIPEVRVDYSPIQEIFIYYAKIDNLLN